MSTEKKWVDYWADFHKHYARMRTWVGKGEPYAIVDKTKAISYINSVVGACLINCDKENVVLLRKLAVHSKSVTWRSLAQRMEALCELCIVPGIN